MSFDLQAMVIRITTSAVDILTAMNITFLITDPASTAINHGMQIL